jgi:hypothetical protein
MRWLVVLLFQVCLSQAATYVIAAGVEQYDDPQVSRLTYAVADARSVASAFRASGVPPKNVVLLTSDAKDAAKRPTRIGLLRAFGQVKQQAATDDKLVFFFAGHGVERNGEQYLLGSDTQRDLLEETALPMGVVNKALDGLACGEVLFLIDACRNDPQAGRGYADAELSEEFARGLRPRIGGPTAKPRLVATLLACDAGQRAWESPEDGHGAFSMYLVKALSGQAAGENGQVTLSSLADYVGREVASWASRSKREQRPRLINPEGGDMVILTAPPEPVVSVSFQNHTLAQVVDLLAEQFGAQIVLGPGADATLTVTGRLDNQPLGTVLKVLVAAHHLTVRREAKAYVIEGALPAPGAATVPVPGSLPLAPGNSMRERFPVAILANVPVPADLSRAEYTGAVYQRIRDLGFDTIGVPQPSDAATAGSLGLSVVVSASPLVPLLKAETPGAVDAVESAVTDYVHTLDGYDNILGLICWGFNNKQPSNWDVVGRTWSAATDRKPILLPQIERLGVLAAYQAAYPLQGVPFNCWVIKRGDGDDVFMKRQRPFWGPDPDAARAQLPTVPLYAMVQGCSHQQLRWVLPTANQLSTICYMAIAHGARGLFIDGYSPPEGSWSGLCDSSLQPLPPLREFALTIPKLRQIGTQLLECELRSHVFTGRADVSTYESLTGDRYVMVASRYLSGVESVDVTLSVRDGRGTALRDVITNERFVLEAQGNNEVAHVDMAAADGRLLLLERGP